MKKSWISAWKLQWRLKHRRRPIRFFGLLVPVDRTIMPIEVIRQLLVRDYELPEIMAVQTLVRSNDRILEVGTGLGIVSSIAARIAHAGEVLTFEANPALAESVRALHQLNGITNVTPSQGTLRAKPQQSVETFHLNRNFPESSLIANGNSIGTVEIATRALAEVLAEFRPSVLLCDIEGGEAELLMHSRLDGIRVVILEVHPKVIEASAIAQIFMNLLAQGFLLRLDRFDGQVVAFERELASIG